MSGLSDEQPFVYEAQMPALNDLKLLAGIEPTETGDHIECAETFYGARLLHAFRTVTAADIHKHMPASIWAYRLYPPQDGRRVEPKGLSDQFVAEVHVNHGRWLVRCPLSAVSVGGRCYGAQHAAKSDPRFFCTYCLNEQAGYQFLPVVWPTQVGEIEAELLKRPFKQNRNWVPGESIELLRAELAMETA